MGLAGGRPDDGSMPARPNGGRRVVTSEMTALHRSWHDRRHMGTGSVGGVQLRWGAATHTGRVRTLNEDALFADPPLFIVADGMGGHDAGDVASSVAIDELSRLAEQPVASAADVEACLRGANSRVHDRAHDGGAPGSMGTTVVGMCFLAQAGDPILVFNIGDSRAYRYADRTLAQLSRDHSLVQELVDEGHLDPEAARTHPERNVITKAVGVDPVVSADLWVYAPEPGHRYLLCSDGLTGELADDQISTRLGRPRPPEAVAADLVAAAVAAGGRDNVTVVVVDVVGVVPVDDEITAPRDAVPLGAGGITGVPEDIASADRNGTAEIGGLGPRPLIDDVPLATGETADVVDRGPTFEAVSLPAPSGSAPGDELDEDDPEWGVDQRDRPDGEGEPDERKRPD